MILSYVQNVSNLCIYFLKCYFTTTKWDRNTICVVFYSLNFLKPVRVHNVHLLQQYNPKSDVERGQFSECKISIFELAKFDEHRIPRYQSHEIFNPMTSLGIVQKPAWLHQHTRYQWNFSFFRTDLSTHLSLFHRLQTCLEFLLLPLLVVVYQIKPSNVVEIQQHSPLSNNNSVTTYVHRMIITRPWLFKHLKNDERVAIHFQCLMDIHNKNWISVSFRCWEITFERVYTSIWDTLYYHNIRCRREEKQ